MPSKTKKHRKDKKTSHGKIKRWPVWLALFLGSIAIIGVILVVSNKGDTPSPGKDGEPSKSERRPPARVGALPRSQMNIERYLFSEFRKNQAEEEVSKLLKSRFHNGDTAKILESVDTLAACCVQSFDAQDYLAEKCLGSGDNKMKEIALIALGGTMQDRVIEKIYEVLKNDPDYEVRRVAAASLCQQDSDGVEKGFKVRDLGATIGIGAPYSAKAWDALAEALLEEKSAKVRETITDLLVLGGFPSDSKRYVSLAFDKRCPASIRKQIIYKLQGQIDSKYKARIAGMAGDKQEELTVRMACLGYLEKTTEAGETLKPLAGLLTDDTEPVMLRFLAGRLLLRMETAEILDAFASSTSNIDHTGVNSSYPARSYAVNSLLWMVSNDPDEKEAEKALRTLGSIGDAGMISRVEQAVKMRGSSSPLLNDAAREVVEQIKGGEVGVDVGD